MIKQAIALLFIALIAINSIAQSLNPDVTQATIKQTMLKAESLAKDRIEALVRRRVCSGRISLADGRAVFVENRWSVYK